jgi:hypothetical protein
MRKIRDVLFLIGAAVLFSVSSGRVYASPGEACNNSCDWGPGSCCDIHGADCGTWCNYCYDEGGTSTDVQCSASYYGTLQIGTTCQCES